MKPLNKEQHQTLREFCMNNNNLTTKELLNLFDSTFIVACCDSCANGGQCDSDHHDHTQPLNTVDTSNPPKQDKYVVDADSGDTMRQTEPKSEPRFWMAVAGDVTAEELNEFRQLLSKAQARSFIKSFKDGGYSPKIEELPIQEDTLTKAVRETFNAQGQDKPMSDFEKAIKETVERNQSEHESPEMANYLKDILANS